MTSRKINSFGGLIGVKAGRHLSRLIRRNERSGVSNASKGLGSWLKWKAIKIMHLREASRDPD